jgi:hypothetical protein
MAMARRAGSRAEARGAGQSQVSVLDHSGAGDTTTTTTALGARTRGRRRGLRRAGRPIGRAQKEGHVGERGGVRGRPAGTLPTRRRNRVARRRARALEGKGGLGGFQWDERGGRVAACGVAWLLRLACSSRSPCRAASSPVAGSGGWLALPCGPFVGRGDRVGVARFHW